MTSISAVRRQHIEAQYAHLLNRSFRQRFSPLLAVIALLVYALYAVWFFNVPTLMHEAHWERFGIFLRQWVSYDVQPEFRLKPEGIVVKYPRFSPLGDDPSPDWVLRQQDGSVRVDLSTGKSVSISQTGTTIKAYGETVAIDITSGKPVVSGIAPSWLTLYDGTVTADLGFSGDVTLTAERVKVRKRFLGWANFIFDTQSPFFGKSAGEVISLIASGARIDPEQSNLSLAIDNFWNNSTWQHGDVWEKLFQTIVMAFLGTILAAFLAFPLSFLAARNITPNRAANIGLKRFFDFLRSVDMLIWALFLTRAFGPGPLAGSGAVFLTETGTLGKLYAEGLENLDNKQREGIQSTGASRMLTHRFGIVPQVIPVMFSQTFYQWESNVRGATIIGAVGAGGIGLKLWEAMRTNSNWANVAYMVILILIVVFLFDTASSAMRRRLIGPAN